MPVPPFPTRRSTELSLQTWAFSPVPVPVGLKVWPPVPTRRRSTGLPPQTCAFSPVPVPVVLKVWPPVPTRRRSTGLPPQTYAFSPVPVLSRAWLWALHFPKLPVASAGWTTPQLSVLLLIFSLPLHWLPRTSSLALRI